MSSNYDTDWTRNLDDLILSFIFVSITCFFGLLVRFHLNLLLWNSITSKRTILEFVSNLEAAVFSLEVNYIIYENFPFWIYISALFFFSLYQNWPTRQKEDGNPLETFVSYFKNQISLDLAIFYIFVQVLGASVTYVFIAKPLWSKAEAWTWRDEWNIHTKRIHQDIWPTSIIKDNTKLSILSEAVVTCIMYMIQVVILELRLGEWKTRLSTILINTLVYSTGAPWSGAFYNCAVATGLELLLTSGANMVTKILVYWFAPLCGILIALLAERLITNN